MASITSSETVMVDLPWLHEQRDRSSETGVVDAWIVADDISS